LSNLSERKATQLPTNERYSRKISAEEAKKKHIFILKDSLDFFPPQGEAFTISDGSTEEEVFLESYRCTCRDPQLPHEHYFVQWEGIRFGERITITKDVKAAERYVLVSRR
jgi:hypothetical protein